MTCKPMIGEQESALMSQDMIIENLKRENLELKELIQLMCDQTGWSVSTTNIRFDAQSKWYLKEDKNDP